ncbi:hypothetical protein Taro_012406 [Colocasia esculenta]|uniref:Uncharacterized protein n=1 Tax=Colocasia esculenta TaxID=4460 RepID=A0A843U3U9_COLES|nr:hypothetical protein [Colocasia esculenta]
MVATALRTRRVELSCSQGLELQERGRSSKNSFSPRDPLLLGLFPTSNNLWQRARVGQEGCYSQTLFVRSVMLGSGEELNEGRRLLNPECPLEEAIASTLDEGTDRREATVRGCDLLPRKLSRKDFFNWWKEEMELAGRDSNQARAASFNVAKKARHFAASDAPWNTMCDSNPWT